MTCPKCRASQLVEIGLVVRDSRLTMHSCPSCEIRWWDSEGQQMAIDGVLALASR